MDSVEICGSITWTKNRLSPAEKLPQLKCFLDARFDRGVLTLPLKKTGDSIPFKITGNIDRNVPIPPTTSICFVQMAFRSNDFGVPCPVDTGVAEITFQDIKNNNNEIEVPLIMRTVGGIEKGAIKIKIDSMKVPRININTSINSQMIISAKELVSNYIGQVMQIEQQMPELYLGTEQMRVPYDYSEAGFRFGYPMPSLTFCMAEIPKTNVKYWENVFDTVMKRDDLSFDRDWNKLNLDGKGRVVTHALAYAAQYNDYISDQVDKNINGSQRYDPSLLQGCENFGTVTEAADCEDDGNAINGAHQSFIQLNLAEFGNSQIVASGSNLLEAQKIARGLVPVLNLDVVRGAQVKDQTVSYGAHMNVNFIPIKQFIKWIPAEIRGQLPDIPEHIETSRAYYGEGTGFCDATGYVDPLLATKRKVYSCGSLQKFHLPIQPDPERGFFVGSLNGYVSYFYHLGMQSPMGVWYTTGGKRGASYIDIMKSSKNIALKVQPFPPKRVMEVCKEANYSRLPPKELTLTQKDTTRRSKNHILEKIKSSVASWNRPAGDAHLKVPVYIRPHQLTEKDATAIIGDFQRQKDIWKVDYALEEINDDTWGYRMSVWCK